MVLAYSLALLYGVFQLWLFASPTRTIRFRTAMTGFVCGAVVTFPLAVLLGWSWVRLADRFVTRPRFELVLWASWTVDPFIEELVRLVPLIVVLMVVPRCRWQWSLSDLVVLGAAVGSGYRWGEHLARYPSAPNPVWAELSPYAGGWFLGGLDGTKVEPPWVWVFDWLPEGVTVADNTFAPGLFQIYNVLLVWGTLGGLAIGLWTVGDRQAAVSRWSLRSTSVALVIFAGLSHAAVNAQARAGEWPLGLLSVPRLFEPWFWAWPLFALTLAMAADWIMAVRSEYDPSRFRVTEANEPIALATLALQRPAVSVPAVLGFVRMRRNAVRLAPADDEPADLADAVAAMALTLSTQLESDIGLWDEVATERAQIRRTRLRRLVGWPGLLLSTAVVLLWLFPVAYFVAGGTFRWAGVQNWIIDHSSFAVAPAVAAALLTVVVAGLTVTRWPSIPDTISELKARLVFGLLTQGFTLAGTGLILYRYRTGNSLNGPLMTNVFHGLEAMAALLLVAGLAVLVLAAGIVLLSTGAVLLPTGGVLFGLTATELAIGATVMSASRLALMNASGSSLGAPPGMSPSQIRVPIPGPLPPLPPEVAAAAAAAIVTTMADQPDHWQPDPARDPHHYLDANGDLRWRDTNQLVAHNPNRPRYTDNHGTERWADTDQPVDSVDTSNQDPQRSEESAAGVIGEDLIRQGDEITPPDWVARIADNGKGVVWQRPGSAGNADLVRIMAPTERYPAGYVRFHNRFGQPIDLNGKPSSRAETHIPLRPGEKLQTPQGWP